MEDISETVSSTVKNVKGDSSGFFKYVFNFDEENKCDIMNLVQYTLLAIIPVLVLLKIVKQIIPEEDDSKGSLEILVECVGQIIFILGFMWIINKTIRFIPTYSNCEYEKFLPTNFIIPFLIILITMQTKLGAKFNILIERVTDYWNGTSSNYSKSNSNSNNVMVSQPFSNEIPRHQPSQSDYIDQLLPSDPQLTAMTTSFSSNKSSGVSRNANMQQQQGPDFSQMYQTQPTPLLGANQAPNRFEPAAANDSGSPFSAW
jgi:hypothetical protein